MVLWEITLATAYVLGLKRTFKLALQIQRRLIGPRHPKLRRFVYGRTRAVFDVVLKVQRSIQERDTGVGGSLGNWILQSLDRIKPSAQIPRPPPGIPPSGGNASTNAKKQFTSSFHQKTPGGFQKGDRESGRHLFTSSRNTWSRPFAMMIRPAKTARTNMLQFLDRMKASAQINKSINVTKQFTGLSHQKSSGGFKGLSSTGDKDSDSHLITSTSNTWVRSFPMMIRSAKTAGINIHYGQLSFFGPEVLRLSPRRGVLEGVIRKDIMQLMVQR